MQKLRKRPSNSGAKVQTKLSLTAKGSAAPSTPTTMHIIPGSGTADIIGTWSPGKKHIHGQMPKPKLSLSGPLSSPLSSAGGGGGRTSPTLDAQFPTFPRYAPSGMRSPTTPTATGNANARSFSGINSPPPQHKCIHHPKFIRLFQRYQPERQYKYHKSLNPTFTSQHARA